MTLTTLHSTRVRGTRDRARLERRRVAGLASITVVFLATSSAPTPLYSRYQREWGFSDQLVTIIFGAYALALLVTLLSAGRLSDHLGRRRVVIAGTIVQVVAMAMFIEANSVASLLAARIIQGVATGVTLGAVGAAMLDINPRVGAIANATAPGLGTASGAVLSAGAVQWLPAPTTLVYFVFAVVLIAQALWVTRLPETSPLRPGTFTSLIPDIRVPVATRGAFVGAAPVLFAVWALAGFYGSLGPTLIAGLVHSSSALDAGLGLGVLAGVAALVTFVLRNWPAPRVMMTGAATLVAGVVTVMIAVSTDSPVLFFVGTAVAGVAFGAGFQGAMRLVTARARAAERAGVVAMLYVISYVAMGVPAVAAGFAVVHGLSLTLTSVFYLAGVAALAGAAMVNMLRVGRRERIAEYTRQISLEK